MSFTGVQRADVCYHTCDTAPMLLPVLHGHSGHDSLMHATSRYYGWCFSTPCTLHNQQVVPSLWLCHYHVSKQDDGPA